MDHLLDGIRRSAKKTTVEEKLARLEEALPLKDTKSDIEEETPDIPIWSTVTQYGTAFTAAISGMTNRKYRVAIAAGFSLLIIATFTLFNIIKDPTPEKLFAQYYEPFDNQSRMTLRGGEENTENIEVELLQNALSEYDRGNYAESIELFNRIPDISENKISVWMYKGNALLHEGQVEDAKIMFQNIISENAGFEVHAKWYLSLCYIKNGDYENAKSLLEEIRDLDKYKNKEAGKILSKI
jgi:tetratricopeptide (TPR) repeat protein